MPLPSGSGIFLLCGPMYRFFGILLLTNMVISGYNG